MALKDHKRHFSSLNLGAVAEVLVPNTVSRSAKTGDRAFAGVVAEAGRPVFDADLNLHADAQFMENFLFRQWHHPSGWLRGRTHLDGYCDYTTETAPSGLNDAVGDLVHADDTLVNSLILPKLVASVAGRPVVVEYTNTSSAGYNLVELATPTLYDGTNSTVKRTDFVFLEVWAALVAPSPRASGFVEIVSNADLTAGDVITINGVDLTAVASSPGVDEFEIGGDAVTTASNIATALIDPSNSFDGMITATSTAQIVTVKSVVVGDGSAVGFTGNYTTLGVTVATVGAMTVSGATLAGGSDRPNKPSSEQGQLYRHGNVLSPSATWLDDELLDPTADVESSQRVQWQYRIRSTSESEQVNYKTHPDGFSSLRAGGGASAASVFAQGARSIPVWTGNGQDSVSYPFVRADGADTWLESSAAAYGIVDDGLWVAGDGSETAAQALGTADGFVYAIPICFVHRHNNASDASVASKGFDPVNNANGAPEYDHAGFSGVLGSVPAGESDRPDGHFCDVVTQDNILDLRRHVLLSGVDLGAELQYQMQSLLDGSLRTWSVDTADKQILGGSSGDVSTRFLVCNEIGRSQAAGGNAPFSGDTDRGEVIRNFDHVARRFGSQPVVEKLVVAFYPGDRPDGSTQGGPAGSGVANPGKYVTKYENPAATVADADAWYEGDTLVLDFGDLDASTLGGLWQGLDGDGASATGLPSSTFSSFAPAGTVITDVLGMWHDDGHYTTAVSQDVEATTVIGLGTQRVEITLDANGRTVNGGDSGNSDHIMVGSDVSGSVPGSAALLGSPRRIFVEFEVTYPIGAGLTDTPDHEVTPSPAFYDGSGQGPGPVIENSTAQRPADFETILAPRFRAGFREVQLEYVANDTVTHASGAAGAPIGSINSEQLVSRNRTELYFPRRVFGTASGPMANQTQVTDAVVAGAQAVDEAATEFGSSSRKVKLDSNLSGAGQTLCDIQYFAQDPIPNYGVSGAGYQLGVYFRTNAPQTAGVKDGDIGNTGGGTLPTTLRVEPLLMSPDVWTGQVGVGSSHNSYPYAVPLDQVPINDGTPLNPADPTQQPGVVKEWYFAASAMVSVDDFNADTGLLALRPFVQGDVQNILTFGGTGNNEKPRKDAEFRAFYPYADTSTYRPTVLSQPLHGATRHKVMVPMLVRAIEDVEGAAGGILFRKSELLLVVLTRFAELDDENNVRFLDAAADNRTLAAVYRTRNLLLTVGDRTCL